MLQVVNSLLGPFVGSITATNAKVWFQMGGIEPKASRSITVTLNEGSANSDVAQSTTVQLSYNNFGVGIVTFNSLRPDTLYYYRLWQDADHLVPIDLQGLIPEDLNFRTLPTSGYDKQLDFLLMSCHNPEKAKDDGFDGFAVWARMPEIIAENKNVRFAILAGDQVYGDDIQEQALAEQDLRKRQELYLGVYKKFWDNLHYRKVLCSLPSLLMWDDHDVTDGWGSRDDSFVDGQSSEFKPEWEQLFEAAKDLFKQMQAVRNPDPLSKDFELGFDTCSKIGRAGFAVADLRTNRNVRKKQIWLPEQLHGIRKWVEEQKSEIDTLFFVSSVVFSHGDPGIERYAVGIWPLILQGVAWIGARFSGQAKFIAKAIKQFNDQIGDLRDDINDSWGSEPNKEEVDRVLDFLFDLQNPSDGSKPINVVILTGDIHTAGYSTIYSANPDHSKRAVIPHIVATPVAYEPFSWIGEAVYRHLTTAVNLGASGKYSAQVSHHFCYRNVVVVSLRNFGEDESFLKVKYYIEGFPEPQIMFFDLNRGSHREVIHWPNPKQKPISFQ